MACPGAITGAQGRAFGGFSGGGGFASSFASIATSVANVPMVQAAQSSVLIATAAVGSPAELISNPLTVISSAAASQMQNPALSIGKAFLTGDIPSSAQAALGGVGDMMKQAQAHVTRFTPVDVSSAIQIFDQVDSFSKISRDIMPNITRQLGTSFGAVTSVVTDFTDGGFTGGGILDFNDMLTNGIAGLTDGVAASVTDLGTSFQTLGKFGDLADVANLMQPGQVMNQMLNAGLGEIGNIQQQLTDLGIPLDDLANGKYQDAIQGVMDTVTDSIDLSDIQSVMGSAVDLSSLGDVTDFTKMIDSNITTTFASFSELGDQMAVMATGTMESIGDFGELVSDLSVADDLTSMLSETTVLDQVSFDEMTSVFGGGSGPDGSMLVRDLIGSAAGYGHDVFLNEYQTGMNALNATGITGTMQQMYAEANAAIAGDYTIGSDITDPRTGSIFTDLDSFIKDKATQISGEVTSIVASDNPIVQNALTLAEDNWNSSADQLTSEINNLAQTDVDPDLITPGHKGSMFSFATRLGERGSDTNDTGDILERFATDDLNGEAMKLALREGRNQAALMAREIDYTGNIVDTTEDVLTFAEALAAT